MQEKKPGPAWRIKVGRFGGKVGVPWRAGEGGRAWEANGMDFQPVGRSLRGVPSVPSGSCSPHPSGQRYSRSPRPPAAVPPSRPREGRGTHYEVRGAGLADVVPREYRQVTRDLGPCDSTAYAANSTSLKDIWVLRLPDASQGSSSDCHPSMGARLDLTGRLAGHGRIRLPRRL